MEGKGYLHWSDGPPGDVDPRTILNPKDKMPDQDRALSGLAVSVLWQRWVAAAAQPQRALH